MCSDFFLARVTAVLFEHAGVRVGGAPRRAVHCNSRALAARQFLPFAMSQREHSLYLVVLPRACLWEFFLLRCVKVEIGLAERFVLLEETSGLNS